MIGLFSLSLILNLYDIKQGIRVEVFFISLPLEYSIIAPIINLCFIGFMIGQFFKFNNRLQKESLS